MSTRKIDCRVNYNALIFQHVISCGQEHIFCFMFTSQDFSFAGPLFVSRVKLEKAPNRPSSILGATRMHALTSEPYCVIHSENIQVKALEDFRKAGIVGPKGRSACMKLQLAQRSRGMPQTSVENSFKFFVHDLMSLACEFV